MDNQANKNIDMDQEYNLYKVTYNGVESYCVGEDIQDIIAGYEELHEVTKIELIDNTYLSPGIYNQIDKPL